MRSVLNIHWMDRCWSWNSNILATWFGTFFFGKDHDAGKDWRQEEKGTTEDDTVWWHLQLNGHGFRWTLGVGNGQGNLVCCSPWACKESDMHWLNWTDSILYPMYIDFKVNIFSFIILRRSQWSQVGNKCAFICTYVHVNIHTFTNICIHILLLFSCSLCNPMDCGPPGFPVFH